MGVCSPPVSLDGTTAAESGRHAAIVHIVNSGTGRLWRWEFAYPALRTNEIIASLDAVLLDPTTSKVMWETHRPVKPVQLHGDLFAGQANVVAAQELMQEVFASLGPRHLG
jgi:hypothetical protein